MADLPGMRPAAQVLETVRTEAFRPYVGSWGWINRQQCGLA